jgi:hypothetical protein
MRTPSGRFGCAFSPVAGCDTSRVPWPARRFDGLRFTTWIPTLFRRRMPGCWIGCGRVLSFGVDGGTGVGWAGEGGSGRG